MNRFIATIRNRFSKGFTLAEVVIATTVFVIVGLIGVTVFVNVIRIQQKVQLENAIYEDGRFMMERIAREIRMNTIDYEEFYRADNLPVAFLGQQFGCYAQKFYNLGTDDAAGARCNDGSPASASCVIDKTTQDINTGQNPYAQPLKAADDANAFCDEYNHGDAANDCATANNAALHEQPVLYLINPEGTQKTTIAYKKVNNGGNPEYAVSMLKLNGEDTNTDGVYETWGDFSGAPAPPNYFGTCETGYDCAAALNLDTNLSSGAAADRYIAFVPLTPLRTNVTSLKFYVAPLEDPRKAYAETAVTDGIQQQPHVTIVLTLQPATSELRNYQGAVPTITLQTTVSARVYNEVKSYIPDTIPGC